MGDDSREIESWKGDLFSVRIIRNLDVVNQWYRNLFRPEWFMVLALLNWTTIFNFLILSIKLYTEI